jgi:hypothetical protein
VQHGPITRQRGPLQLNALARDASKGCPALERTSDSALDSLGLVPADAGFQKTATSAITI